MYLALILDVEHSQNTVQVQCTLLSEASILGPPQPHITK